MRKCFAREKGYEIIFDTAKFWASRLEWQPEKKQYEILDVIGPDEYKEHANNNAFTNYTAHWNMTLAIKLYEELQQHDVELWKTLSDKLELERVYPEWLEKVDRIYLPKANENCIIPQDDEYLSKKVIDLTKYKMDEAVGTLFHDYNLEQVNNMQVTKQADVLLLLFLFEHLFTKEEKVANWNYYEPKTTHDSSLSLSTHAILAADLGESDEAYRLFRQAAFIDLGEHMNSSNEGIHAASLGGVWQATVFGFGGVRALNGQLRIEPHLPKEWDSLQFGIEWQGNPLVVTVTKEQISIENNGKKTVEFVSKGQQYQIQTKNKIVL